MLPSPFQDKRHSFRPEDVLILYALGTVTTWWNVAKPKKLRKRDPDKRFFQLYEDFWPLLGIHVENIKKWIQACITVGSALFFQMQEPNIVSSKIIHTSSFIICHLLQGASQYPVGLIPPFLQLNYLWVTFTMYIIPDLLVSPSEDKRAQVRAMLYLTLNPQHLVSWRTHSRYSNSAYSWDHFLLVNLVSIANLIDELNMYTDSRTHFASWFSKTNALYQLILQWLSHFFYKDLCCSWCLTKSAWLGEVLIQVKFTFKSIVSSCSNFQFIRITRKQYSMTSWSCHQHNQTTGDYKHMT